MPTVHLCCCNLYLLMLWVSLAFCQNDSELLVGERRNLSIQESTGTVTFLFYLNRTAEDQSPALRLFLTSNNATVEHPLLVTALQTRGVASWAIPHVESGYAYSSVERTLCPLYNIDPDNYGNTAMVELELSTSSPTPIDVQLSSKYFDQFYHRLNDVTSLSVSPYAPAYLLFEHPREHPDVRVKFSSLDATRNVCAIASIQKTFCPVTELLDNPDHRGIYQTMLSQATIDIELLYLRNHSVITNKQQSVFSFFYIVLSVFPSMDNCSTPQMAEQAEMLTLEVLENFTPALADGPLLMKNINITVEPVIEDWKYGVAAIIPFIIFSLLYVGALTWIYLSDKIHFFDKPMVELLEERAAMLRDYHSEEGEVVESITETSVAGIPSSQDESSMERGITRAMSDVARQLSDEGKQIKSIDLQNIQGVVEADGVTPVTTPTQDQTTPHSSPDHLLNVDGHHSGKPTGHWSLSSLFTGKKGRKDGLFGDSSPGFFSVLRGSQYDKALNNVMQPSPHYPEYLQEKSVKVYTPKTSVKSGGSVKSDGSKPVKRQSSAKRQSSVRPSYNPSISLTVPVVQQVAMHNKRQLGLEPAGGRDETDYSYFRSGHQESHRRGSYESAVQMGSVDDKGQSPTVQVREDIEQSPNPEEETKCMKLCGKEQCICDLGEFDETCYIQKKYNLLSWYLVASIIFYAIPAYQLVTTYQQLLTISGNQDLCYFNNLCSYRWRTTLITFSAFNNLYSNIGYIMLGFLFIFITYRRQRVYRVVYSVVNSPYITNKWSRVGVPQHFGIYYAIGVAMIAEGLMSTAYHICPGRTNYQFDTTFMYVMAALGIFKLIESRSPDLKPPLHQLLLVVACMILFVVVGVLASGLIFYIAFFIVHVVVTFGVTVEIYYHWKIKIFQWSNFKKLFQCSNFKKLFHFIANKSFWPPVMRAKWMFVLTSNGVNWLFAIYGVAVRPPDFGTFFLFILLANFILLFVYYTISKCIYRDWPSIRPIIFLVLALSFWSCGIYFYSLAASNWLLSPAASRDGNRECFAVVFDSHDMWHFSSALALFFSFLMLTTIDDNAEATCRTKLRVF